MPWFLPLITAVVALGLIASGFIWVRSTDESVIARFGHHTGRYRVIMAGRYFTLGLLVAIAGFFGSKTAFVLSCLVLAGTAFFDAAAYYVSDLRSKVDIWRHLAAGGLAVLCAVLAGVFGSSSPTAEIAL